MANHPFVSIPHPSETILLHSCCAPCSSGIIHYLLKQHIKPVIFYFNPNIFPQEEYEIRKAENKRYAKALNLDFVDADYDHEAWKKQVQHLSDEPERGERCLECFKIRLAETARYASKNGIKIFTTTLASSRWKSLSQINEAGNYAAILYPGVTFWTNNWRKNGLAQKQTEIIREYDFYRQQYCGCEYSLHGSVKNQKQG